MIANRRGCKCPAVSRLDASDCGVNRLTILVSDGRVTARRSGRSGEQMVAGPMSSEIGNVIVLGRLREAIAGAFLSLR